MDGFIMENLIKMDDLGVPRVPLFSETPKKGMKYYPFMWGLFHKP